MGEGKPSPNWLDVADALFLSLSYFVLLGLGAQLFQHFQILYYFAMTVWKRESYLHHAFSILYLLLYDAAADLAIMQIPIGILILGREFKSLALGLVGYLLFLWIRIPYHLSEIITRPSADNIETAFRLAVFAFGVYFSIDLTKRVAKHIDHQDLAFRIFGLFTGQRALRVKDPDLIHTILREYANKGIGLEARVSLPAWYPVRSLESVDGEEWEVMHQRFIQLTKLLPPADLLRVILLKQLQAVSNLVEIDSITFSRVIVKTFIEYLFGVPWTDDMEIFVDASIEWRKEIALRGRGKMTTKMAAVERVLALLRDSQYWSLFKNDWTLPGFYSIVLQPFIISPAINFSDVLVSICALPPDSTKNARDVIMMAHPFPIFERFVDDNRYEHMGVPANTHVFMFTADMKPKSAFSAGKRVCPGAPHGVAIIDTLIALRGQYPFAPLKNHLYSGRDNDTNMTIKEGLYFVSALLRAILNIP